MKQYTNQTDTSQEGVMMTAQLSFDEIPCIYQVWKKDEMQSDVLIIDSEELELLQKEEIETWFRTLHLISDPINNPEVVINQNSKDQKTYINFNFELVR